MNSKDALIVFVGTHPIGLRYMPQKAIGSALKLQASPHKKNTRRSSFTTPPDRSAAIVEQAKALYSEFLGARLSAAPEESDVVHDMLASLAEQMIKMNKKKNEIKIVEESISGGKDAKETEIAG